jgi:predicted SAM-dependent methyltransferase
MRGAAVRLRQSIKHGWIRRLGFWLSSGHLIRDRRVRKWIRSSPERFLQVGGGRHLIKADGWMNGDMVAGDIFLDATKRFPIPDACVTSLFTEHFVEHLPQQSVEYFFQEALRVLKPGGVLRQSTPDLGLLLQVYDDTNEHANQAEVVDRHMRNHRRNARYARSTACQFLNDMFRMWGHQFIYDRATLEAITRESGFVNCKWVKFGESEAPQLRARERHADEEWMKEAFVMILEAEKP